jgi:hypothetical protein
VVAFRQHDLFGFEGGGAVGTLDDELGCDFVGVGFVDGLFEGRGNEYIAECLDGYAFW